MYRINDISPKGEILHKFKLKRKKGGVNPAVQQAFKFIVRSEENIQINKTQ
jgi:hypothetical protein